MLAVSSAQQSVHQTLGILRNKLGFIYAGSFIWLDGFAVPAHKRVTQTVEQKRGKMFSEEQVRKMLEEMFNEGRRYESASYQPQTRADAIKYYSDKIISAQHGVQSDLALTCQACTEKPATVHHCNDCYFGN